jgi:hypothetical protein
MCGCIHDTRMPAVAARCLSRRVAACRRAALLAAESACQHPRMDPIKVIETEPGKYSLWLDAEATDVDD